MDVSITTHCGNSQKGDVGAPATIEIKLRWRVDDDRWVMGHAKQVVVNHVTAVDSLLNSHPVVRRFAAFGDHRSYLRRGTEAEIETGTDPKLSGRTPCDDRSEEHTSELPSLMRITYAVFCLK